MMQKLELRSIGLKPTKIGHVDSVSVTNGSPPLRRFFGAVLLKRSAAEIGPAPRLILHNPSQ